MDVARRLSVNIDILPKGKLISFNFSLDPPLNEKKEHIHFSSSVCAHVSILQIVWHAIDNFSS